MHRFFSHTLLLGSLLGLLVGCGEVVPGGSGSIAGTVTAPAGGNVAGTRVIACFNNEPGCEQLDVTIEESGSAAAYEIDRLPRGSYGVIALKDVNGDGDARDIGDYFGMYESAPGIAELVTPPVSEVGIQLRLLTGAMQSVPEAVLELSSRAP